MAKTSVTLERCLADFIGAMGEGARFAVVGGLAVSARTVPRFTADLDFAVSVTDDGIAEALVFRLSARGFRPEAILERPDTGRIATARLRQAKVAPFVDLLFAASGIEPEIVEASEPLTILGQEVHVARTGHLIAMKLIARDDKKRPLDRADLVALSLVADDTEWARAAEAVQLIADRGFARNRDLRAALAEWRALASEP